MNNKKSTFGKPEAEVVTFDTVDVIRTSDILPDDNFGDETSDN